MILPEIKQWIDTLIIPRLELDNLPICPYARQALNLYSINTCTFNTIEEEIRNYDISKFKVSIFYFEDYHNYDIEILNNKTSELNSIFNKENLIILDNDPRTPFYLNGVKTTFDLCYLWIVQELHDLNEKSNNLKEKTTYYSFWTKEQLDDVVNWRTKK
jgi:hypothetical protein